MSQVNLLPPEIRTRQAVRQRTVMMAIIGGAAMLLIVAFYFLQIYNLSKANDDLEAQKQQNAQLQTQVAGLSEFGDLQEQLKKKQDLAKTVFKDEIAWSGVLMDVSRVMPPEAVLTSFTAQETALQTDQAGAVPPPTTVGGPPPGELVGTLTFAGNSVGVDGTTSFLSKAEDVQGWANPYATDVSETSPRSGDYSFSATADLTKDIITPRGQGEETP
jgi:hypothetical protein